MFYAARGSIPPKRHTQHRAPDGSLYAEELFGVEGFTGRSSLLYHLVPPTRTHQIEPVGAELTLEEADDGYHHHRLIDAAGRRAAGRRDHRPDPAVLQQRHRDGRRPPGRGDARDRLLPQRRGRRAALRPRGQRPARHRLRADPLRPGRLPRPPDRDDLAARAGRRQRRSGCSTSSARRRSRRRSAIATTTASCSSTRRTRSATSGCPTRSPPRTDEGEFQVHVKMRNRLTAYHYAHHPFDVVGWDGYLWPFAFNIGDFEPITGRVHQPPPVHQTFAARNFVVCSFVPRKFDYHPLAIPAPYNHSNINSRRGHLLRRRQLHEPPRRGDLVVHAPPGGHPARAAPGHGGGLDRQGGDRGAGGHGRHVPPAQDHEAGGRRSRTTATRIRGCRPRTPPARLASCTSAGRRRSRTERPLSARRSNSTSGCDSSSEPSSCP